MADCSKCQRTDVKCCYTCKKNVDKCEVWHKCGSDCPEHESRILTNADRIRAMSDEELAKERIDRIDIYTKSDLEEFIGDFDGIVNSEEEAIKKELDWLQSEAE